MEQWKTKKCSKKENHRKQECKYYHENEKEQRRRLLDSNNGLAYLPYICFSCEEKEECNNAHNFYE